MYTVVCCEVYRIVSMSWNWFLCWGSFKKGILVLLMMCPHWWRSFCTNLLASKWLSWMFMIQLMHLLPSTCMVLMSLILAYCTLATLILGIHCGSMRCIAGSPHMLSCLYISPRCGVTYFESTLIVFLLWQVQAETSFTMDSNKCISGTPSYYFACRTYLLCSHKSNCKSGRWLSEDDGTQSPCWSCRCGKISGAYYFWSYFWVVLLSLGIKDSGYWRRILYISHSRNGFCIQSFH